MADPVNDDPCGDVGAIVEQVLLLQRQMERMLADLLKGQSVTQGSIAELSKSLGKTTPAAPAHCSSVEFDMVTYDSVGPESASRLTPSMTDRLVKLSSPLYHTEASAAPDQGLQDVMKSRVFSARSLSTLTSMQRIKIAPGIEDPSALDHWEAEDKLDQLMGLGMYQSETSEEHKSMRPSMLQGIGRRTFMMDPHGKPRVAHDLLSIVVLGVDAMSAPVILAWDVSVEGFLYMFNILAVGFWTLDIFLSFITAFHVQGELVTRPSLVARRYLKSWFLPDLSVVLADLITLSMVGSADSSREMGAGVLRFSKVGRFLRLARMCRLARAGQAFARLTDASVHLEIVVDIVKPLLALLMVNHILACLWWSISRWLPSDTGFSWVDEWTSATADVSYGETNIFFQYLTCLHWSLTQQTPGSMEVVPRNSNERAFNCFCLLFGMLLFSSLISTISAKMMQHYLKQKDNLAKLTALRRFLTNRVQPSIAYAAQFKATKAMAPNSGKPTTMNEVSVIAILPQALQRSIRVDLCEKHLKHPLFRWWLVIDSKGAHNLCHEAIDFVGLAAEDHLFFPRTAAIGAYIMMRGAAVYIPELIDEEEEPQVVHGQFFCEVALWCKWKHVGELTAVKSCEVLSISSEGLVKCLDQDAAVKHVVTEYGRAFHSRLLAPKMPEDKRDDVFVSSTELASILPSLPMQCRQLFGAVAVKVHRTGKSRKPLSASMTTDIRDGRCCLMLNWEGEVERIVSTAALSLWCPDGRRLMQLGVRSGERNVALYQLPSKQVEEDETQDQAFERLLGGVFAPLADSIGIAPSDVELQVWTKQLPERTRHSRMVHHATLTCQSDDLGLEACRAAPARVTGFLSDQATFAGRRSRQRGSITTDLGDITDSWAVGGGYNIPASIRAGDISVYSLAGPDSELVLVAWLGPEEERAFASPGGEARLQRLLDKLVLEPETLEAARTRFDHTLGMRGSTTYV